MTAPKLVLHPAASQVGRHPLRSSACCRHWLIGRVSRSTSNPTSSPDPIFWTVSVSSAAPPSIQLDPPRRRLIIAQRPRAGRFCHIQLHTTTDAPQLRYKHDQNPRCRRCRADIPAQLLHATQRTPLRRLRHTASLSELNWATIRRLSPLLSGYLGHPHRRGGTQRPAARGPRPTQPRPWQFFYIED